MLLALILLSCGKRFTNDSLDVLYPLPSNEGTYSALLIPVNGKISAAVNGEVRVERYGDQFDVNIVLKNPPPGKLGQSLYLGSSCPKMGQDVNRDGQLDGHESRLQTGSIIIPFDGDLSSQFAGAALTLKGSYFYSRSTSYSLMLSDLHLADEIVNDLVVKLGERDLTLERRPVMVYLKLSRLSTPVSGRDIPLACGVLTKVSSSPYFEGPGGESLGQSLAPIKTPNREKARSSTTTKILVR